MPENLFVYGSLLRGRRNHGLLEHTRFLGEAVAYDVGLYAVTPYFPGAVPEKNKAVRGELYEISLELLLDIDKLEDNGKLYRRRLWPVCSTFGCDRYAAKQLFPGRSNPGNPVLEEGCIFCRKMFQRRKNRGKGRIKPMR